MVSSKKVCGERAQPRSGAGGREGADRVPDGAEEEGWPRVPFDEERGELLHRHPPEAGAKGAAAHAAEEIAPLGLEALEIQGLPVVTGEAELHRDELAALDDTPETLDNKGSVVGVEPVSLTLAEDQVAPLRCPLHGAQEKPEHEGIDDLGAVVEDTALAVYEVMVLAHAGPIVVPGPGRGNAPELACDATGA